MIMISNNNVYNYDVYNKHDTVITKIGMVVVVREMMTQ